MKFYELTLGSRTLKLRLTANNSAQLEKSLGRNPLSMFMGIETKGELPMLSDFLKVITYSAQALEHGITLSVIQSLYDEYVDEGKDYTDLIPEVLEVFKVSGFLKEKDLTADKEMETPEAVLSLVPEETSQTINPIEL